MAEHAVAQLFRPETPGEIEGEPAIQADSLELVADNGVEAVVSVADGPTARVYLKRVVRQDVTVVGYDPR